MSTMPPPTLQPLRAPQLMRPVQPVQPVVLTIEPAPLPIDYYERLAEQARFVADLEDAARRHERRRRRHHLLHRTMGITVMLLMAAGAFAAYHYELYDVRRFLPSAEEHFADDPDVTTQEPSFRLTFPAQPTDVTRSTQVVVQGVVMTSARWTVEASDTKLQVEAFAMTGSNPAYDPLTGLGNVATAVVQQLEKSGTRVTEQPTVPIAGVDARHFVLHSDDLEGVMDIVRSGTTMVVMTGTCDFHCPPARYAELAASLTWSAPDAVPAPAP